MNKKEDEKEEKKEEKISKIDALANNINKKYGAGTIMRAGEAKSIILDRVSFGIFDLDVKSGGGVPRGRITMLKGEESTGKTAVALSIAAEFQRCDRYTGLPFMLVTSDGEVQYLDFGRKGEPDPMQVVWVDVETCFDPKWAMKWGVDPSKVLVIQTEYAEQAIDVTDMLIRSGACDLVVVDSIAALAPGIEIEETSEKWQVGVMARLMNKALRKWTSAMNSHGLLAKTKCTMVLINQMRLNLSNSFCVSMTSPGGKGLDYHQSIEIKFKMVGVIEDPLTGRIVGIKVEFDFKKNKTAPAHRKGIFELYFVTSPSLNLYVGDTDEDGQILRSAVFWEVIKQGGKWFTFPSFLDTSSETEVKCDGMANAREYLRNHQDLIPILKKKVLDNEAGWMQTGIAPNAKKETEESQSEDADSKNVGKRRSKSKKKIS